MTEDELRLLRNAGVTRLLATDGDPRFVRVTYTSGAVSHNGRPGWQRRQRGEIVGWTDNLDEKAGSVMVYGRDEVAALRFWEIERVEQLAEVRD